VPPEDEDEPEEEEEEPLELPEPEEDDEAEPPLDPVPEDPPDELLPEELPEACEPPELLLPQATPTASPPSIRRTNATCELGRLARTARSYAESVAREEQRAERQLKGEYRHEWAERNEASSHARDLVEHQSDDHRDDRER
jgi:hypothetical protein